MRSTLQWLFSSILLVLFALAPLHAQSFPKATGYVSDFAHFLSEEDARALNNELVAFEQKTSVEMAVVIVTSLEGVSVETYARELGNAWGVGKKGLNNGVVFLLAPNEKKLWISPGGGVKSLLTKDVCDQIRTDVIRRASSKQQGVIDGTHAIMRVLLGGSVVEGEAARGGYSTETQQQFTPKTFFSVLGGFIVLVTVLGFGIYFYDNRKNTLRLLESIPRVSGRIEKKLTSPGVKQESKDDFERLKNANLSKLGGFLNPRKQSWSRSVKILSGIQDKLYEISCDVDSAIREYQTAEREGPKLLEKLPAQFDELEQKLKQGKPSPMAEEKLAQARASYERAVSEKSGMTAVDWIILYAILSSISEDASKAEQLYNGDNGIRSSHSSRAISNAGSTDYGFGGTSNFGGGGDFGGGGGGDW